MSRSSERNVSSRRDSAACSADTELARLSPDATLGEVTRYFAAYNLVAGPVVDAADHLLGAVTVDDLLDHMLPENWRDLATSTLQSPGVARG